MFEWINFALLLLSLILFSVLYSISTIPIKLSERRGEKAWNDCKIIRAIAILFEFLSLIFTILWLFYPIEIVNWKIASEWWVGVIIGSIITIPGFVLMYIGMAHAGKETHTPNKDTVMYGGIYNFIRHPQTLGEMPLFIAAAFFVNSWFLVIIMTAYVLIYTPIMIIIEEKDLIRRFGEAYLNYRKRAGALFPKLKTRKENENN